MNYVVLISYYTNNLTSNLILIRIYYNYYLPLISYLLLYTFQGQLPKQQLTAMIKGKHTHIHCLNTPPPTLHSVSVFVFIPENICLIHFVI